MGYGVAADVTDVAAAQGGLSILAMVPVPVQSLHMLPSWGSCMHWEK